jgi:hypothetical protein
MGWGGGGTQRDVGGENGQGFY